MASRPPIPEPSNIFSFMTILADTLRLPEETLAMAFVYMNRYNKYYKTAEQTNRLDAHTLALASLSLSSKGTESPRRLREFLLPAYRLLHGTSANSRAPPLTFPSELYDTLRATIVRAELMLLLVLKFELRIPLPFEFLPRYLDRTLGELNAGGAGWGGTEDYDGMGREKRAEYKVVGLSETAIGRGCRGEVVKALQNYQLANHFPARAIAAACLYVTLQSEGLRVTQTVESWLEEVTSRRVDPEDFHDIIVELEQGLINNVLYVIILSAALDLVGTDVPKGVVLLSDVVPSFLAKLLAPSLNIHKVPYSVRVLTFAVLSTCGMLLIALTPETKDGGKVAIKMSGVAVASLSSGGGELSFLGLTHFYGHFSLAAWGSGTGGAGLIGAAAYVVVTTWFGWSVKASLLAFSILPVVMLVGFFVVLPQEQLKLAKAGSKAIYEELPSEDTGNTFMEESLERSGARNPGMPEDDDEILAGSLYSVSARSFSSVSAVQSVTPYSRLKYAWGIFKGNLRRSRSLFIP